MLDVISVYEDAARDAVNKDENGYFSYEMFNRLSRKAELRLIDWLTGHASAEVPPEMYSSQKVRDLLSPFVTKYPKNVSGGEITKPEDYYLYENMYMLSGKHKSDCDEDEQEDDPSEEECNVPIELLSNEKYYVRCNTNIRLLKPSFKKPVAKMTGLKIEFNPSDLGSIVLEYIRYPKFAAIKVANDPVYND
jgi:hypothetical protein